MWSYDHMGSGHREDVFGAIRDTLLDAKDISLNYSSLYKGVNERLRIHKKNPNFTLSSRDFSSELSVLVKDKRLRRKENSESNNKIKPVYFSLTERALKEHRFNILGIDPEKEKRRKLYQLLFFFQAISPPRYLPVDKLDEILSRIPLSVNNLELQGISDYSSDEGATIETYKPIEHISFSIVKDLRGKYVSAKLLSFSMTEILQYLEQTQVNSNSYSSSMPSMTNLGFTKQELHKELDTVFRTLRDTKLIRPIRNVFDSDLRFVFTDERLSELINEILQVLIHQWVMLQQKWNYVRGPTGDELGWLRYFYSETQTNQIITNASDNRRSFLRGKGTASSSHVKSIVEETILSEDYLNEIIDEVNNKYKKVIGEYAIPPNLIEDIFLRKVFSPIRKS